MGYGPIVSTLRVVSMKESLAFIFLTLVAWMLLSSPARGQERDSDYEQVIRITVSALQKKYLQEREIDPLICERWFKNYLTKLDPRRIYFLDSDISEFQKFVDQLPELAVSGDLSFCELVTKRYQERVGPALIHAARLLNHDFDFTLDEEITLSHDAAPVSVKEQNERLRLQVKYDLLIETSSGSSFDQAKKFIRSRYDSIRGQASQIDRERAVELYLDALCRAIDPHSSYWSQSEFNSFFRGPLKEYTIGLQVDNPHGRMMIRGVDRDFQSEDAATSIIGCELLAIRSLAGEIHHVQEIFKGTYWDLVRSGLGQDQMVTLELYDHQRLRRFRVEWPRKEY